MGNVKTRHPNVIEARYRLATDNNEAVDGGDDKSERADVVDNMGADSDGKSPPNEATNEDGIHCQLGNHTFLSQPRYEALSYT